MCFLSSQCLIKRQYNGFHIAVDTTAHNVSNLCCNVAHTHAALLVVCSFVTVAVTAVVTLLSHHLHARLSLSLSRKTLYDFEQKGTIFENYNNNSRAMPKYRDKYETFQQITNKLWFWVHLLFYRRFRSLSFFCSNRTQFFCFAMYSHYQCSFIIMAKKNVGIFLFNENIEFIRFRFIFCAI